MHCSAGSQQLLLYARWPGAAGWRFVGGEGGKARFCLGDMTETAAYLFGLTLLDGKRASVCAEFLLNPETSFQAPSLEQKQSCPSAWMTVPSLQGEGLLWGFCHCSTANGVRKKSRFGGKPSQNASNLSVGSIWRQREMSSPFSREILPTAPSATRGELSLLPGNTSRSHPGPGQTRPYCQ